MDAHEVLAMLSRAGVEARSLTADSRQVLPGAVFLAYPGHGGARDGRDFIGAAVAAGAAAVLWEREGFEWRGEWRVPNLAVPGLKGLAGPLAAEFHGAPSDALAVIGVTGTNGKTSVTRWIAQAMGQSARPCGVIGTLGADCGGWHEDVPNTTPDAIVTQRLLARMRDSGAAACAIEVSSIGLDQARVAGVRFDTAVFTNLTRDHLDYHAGMADYEAAKARLFAWDGLRHAVVNLDDAAGERLLARAPTGARRIAYRVGAAAHVPSGTDALLTAHAPRQDDRGIAFRLESDWGTADIAAPVWGDFNVANLLAVLGVLLSQGIALADARVAVAALRPVPGRMEAIRMPGQPLAVIDYAHTPDALDKALAALRPLVAERGGRLVALFGAGGDRDPGKRPLMGAVAARLADGVILTSDNPRSEDPSRILADIAAGAPEARVIADRGEAIRRTIAEAGAADVILIAGKGHEPHQEIGGQRLPFSDHEVAARALQDRASIAP